MEQFTVGDSPSYMLVHIRLFFADSHCSITGQMSRSDDIGLQIVILNSKNSIQYISAN